MKEKGLRRRLCRRAGALFLAFAVFVTAAPVLADAEESAAIRLLEDNSVQKGTVIKNPDADDYIVDFPFVNNEIGDKDAVNQELAKGGSVALEVGVTVDSFVSTGGATPQVVIYAMNFEDQSSWKQAHFNLSEAGDSCSLQLDLRNYERLDLLGVRIVGCDVGTEVAYTINYARISRKNAAEEDGDAIATLVDPQTQRTGTMEANPYGDDIIWNERFDIPHKLKFGLEGFRSLELCVGVTVTSYSAKEASDEDGPVALIYAMDDQYGNWKQEQVALSETPQTIELKLDLSGYKFLGEFGLRFVGCDLGSSITYTINYAKVTGEGESASDAEKIALNYPLTGKTKEIPFSDTPVGQHGKLSVAPVSGYSAPTIVDKNGKPYQLRGASSHGLAWFPGYINKDAYHSLRDEWGMNLVRIAVYAREGGYTTGSAEAARDDALIQKGVKAATELGMYVIIDWHVLNYNPNEDLEAAKAFFTKYVEMYGDYDNVLFEICNEPTGTEWYDGSENDLYTYCKEITSLIRDGGSDAIVLCGTNQYSSDIDKVAEKPLSEDGFTNVMYSCHFYAASHYESAQKKLLDALEAGVPAFVTEYGICTASGDGRYDTENADKWLGICDENNVSYACWATSNSTESAAYFVSTCNKTEGGWLEEDLTNTGRYLVNYYRHKLEHCWDLGKVTTAPTETANGVKTYLCIMCGESKTEVIPATGKGTTPEKKNPQKGDIIKDAKAEYKVIADNAVEYVAPVNKKAKTATIAKTVTIDGITYRVEQIAKNAFKNNKNLKTLVIGENVKSIGANAFLGCTKLEKATIGKNVVKIGGKAFYGCKKLKKITIQTSKLKTTGIGAKAFGKTHKKAVVKTPKKVWKKYKKMLVKKGINKRAKIKK